MTRFDSLPAVAALVCPPGFEIDIFAEVPRARSLARDPASGAIAVGTGSGEVYGVWTGTATVSPIPSRRCSRASRS